MMTKETRKCTRKDFLSLSERTSEDKEYELMTILPFCTKLNLPLPCVFASKLMRGVFTDFSLELLVSLVFENVSRTLANLTHQLSSSFFFSLTVFTCCI